MGTYSSTFLNGITITNAGQLPVTITDTGYIGDNTYAGASVDVASTLTGTVFNFGEVKTTFISHGNRVSQRTAILLRGGGYVYNGSTGVVDATRLGISMQGAAVSTVVNFGTVLANNHLGSSYDLPAPNGVGVGMAAGMLINGSASAHSPLIEGNDLGVSIGSGSGPGTLDNFAVIQVATNANNPGYYGSSFFDGSGVYAHYSSTVNNYTGAHITAKRHRRERHRHHYL